MAEKATGEKWRKGKAPWEVVVKESDIEGYLRDEAKKINSKAYKTLSPGNDGFPDRLIALPIGMAVFVETKRPGKVSTEQQYKRQRELAGFGFVVFTDIDTKDRVDKVIVWCQKMISGVKICPGVYKID
jgi:hypothetical protein